MRLLVVLLMLLTSCASQASGFGAPYPMCAPGEARDITSWLRISSSDLAEVCLLVAKRKDLVVMSAARSHEGIYDFPMIEIHYAQAHDPNRTSGPTYFYWRRDGKWEELKEVLGWSRGE